MTASDSVAINNQIFDKGFGNREKKQPPGVARSTTSEVEKAKTEKAKMAIQKGKAKVRAKMGAMTAGKEKARARWGQ